MNFISETIIVWFVRENPNVLKRLLSVISLFDLFIGFKIKKPGN